MCAGLMPKTMVPLRRSSGGALRSLYSLAVDIAGVEMLWSCSMKL